MEIDQNKILEHLAHHMQYVIRYDLSEETQTEFDSLGDEFYQYALNEILTNFDAVALSIITDETFDAQNSAQDSVEKIYESLSYRRALHSACDQFLGTQFF